LARRGAHDRQGGRRVRRANEICELVEDYHAAAASDYQAEWRHADAAPLGRGGASNIMRFL